MKIFVRTAVACAATSALVLGGASTALAAGAVPEAPPVSTTVTVLDDGRLAVVAPEEATYTFSHETSVRLYNAAKAGGVAAVSAICAAVITPLFAPVCTAIAVIIVDSFTHPPAENECYQVFAKLGIPPVGVRVVEC